MVRNMSSSAEKVTIG